MSGYLGGYLGLAESTGDDAVETGPAAIPETDTLGTSVATIDLVARALDRMCDYMRP